MKDLEQLLAGWEAGTLSPEEITELKRLLAQPEGRAVLVEDWLLNEAIYDTLKSSPSVAPAEAPAAVSPRIAQTAFKKEIPRRRKFRWLVWREATITVRWPAAVALAASLVFAGLYFYYERAELGRFAAVRGSVTVERNGQKLTAKVGQPIYPSDLVRVPATSGAKLAWADEPTDIELAPGTDLRLFNPIGGKKLSLQTGNLRASVAPQPRWRAMLISTPQAEAKVVGTYFSLSATGTVTRLEVLEGAVRLHKTHLTAIDDKKEVLVHAGETAAATPDAKLTVQFLTGFLSSDVWSVPPGTGFAQAPTVGKLLTTAQESPATGSSSSIERLRGYLLAPATGDFTFWIASFKNDAAAEFWLSRDDDPAHKTRIAFVTRPGSEKPGSEPAKSGAGRRLGSNAALDADWQKSPSQKSMAQKLVRGRRYYIEVWHEGAGPSSLALGWRAPGEAESAQPKMIDLNALCPFVETSASDATKGNSAHF
jgi:hypothetical protein